MCPLSSIIPRLARFSLSLTSRSRSLLASFPPQGDEWWYAGPSDPSTVTYTMYYQLPEDLVCDGESASCVLQWYWVSANSCNPPEFPSEYRLPYNLQDCTAADATYPEEFINCADIVIVDTRGAAAQYAVQRVSGSGSDSSVPPVVLYDAAQSRPRFFDPVSNQELEDTSRSVRKIDKTLAEKAAAQQFCAHKSSGTYANPASRCRSYFVCKAAGSWYFECPLGTGFDADKRRCTLLAAAC